MECVLSLLGLGLIFLIGYMQVVRSVNQLMDRWTFTGTFLQHFDEFFRSLTFDDFMRVLVPRTPNMEAHAWLTLNVLKMDRELEGLDVLDIYRPAYSRVAYTDYPMLINTLMDFRRGSVHPTMVGQCRDVMVMHLGRLQEAMETRRQQLKQPQVWLREGLVFVVTLPLRLLMWIGLVQYRTVEVASRNPIVRMLALGLFLLGLLANVIQVTTGWEPFIALLRSWGF